MFAGLFFVGWAVAKPRAVSGEIHAIILWMVAFVFGSEAFGVPSAGVDEYAVTKREALVGRECVRFVLDDRGTEIVHRAGVVDDEVPGRGCVEILRVIKHGDAEGLGIEEAVVIDGGCDEACGVLDVGIGGGEFPLGEVGWESHGESGVSAKAFAVGFAWEWCAVE